MLTKRLSWLCVFAGGCLSGAALMGLSSRSVARESSPARVSVEDARIRQEPLSPRVTAARPTELRSAPVPPARGEDAGKGAMVAEEESGSSVADVLTRLESAYRDGLVAAAAPSPPPNEAEIARARGDRAVSVTPEAPARSVEPPQAAESPEELVAASSAAVAPAVPVVVPPTAAPATEIPARPVEVSSPPALAAAELPDAPEGQLAAADVRPSINVFNVQGDVYQIQQLQQLQQLQALQYLELLAQSSLQAEHGASLQAQRRGTRRGAPRGTTPRVPQSRVPYQDWGSGFPQGISRGAPFMSSGSPYSAQSPWGFRIPESPLVR